MENKNRIFISALLLIVVLLCGLGLYLIALKLYLIQ
jgi:hypothetical protein